MNPEFRIAPTALSILQSSSLTCRTRNTRTILSRMLASVSASYNASESSSPEHANRQDLANRKLSSTPAVQSILEVSTLLENRSHLLAAWNASGQRDLQARQEWRAAARYPILLLVCCIIAGFFGNISSTMTSLNSMFSDTYFGTKPSNGVPPSVMGNQMVTSIAVALLIGTALVRLAAGARVWGIFTGCLPWIGVAQRQLIASQLFRRTGILLAAEVPLPKAMELASQACDDSVGEFFWRRSARRIADGKTFGSAISEEPWLPRSSTYLIHQAESSGMLEPALQLTADLLENQSRTTAKLMNYLLPPLVLVFCVWFIITNYNAYATYIIDIISYLN